MNLAPYNPPVSYQGQRMPVSTLEAEALEVSRDMGLEFGDAKNLVLRMRYSIVEVL